MKEKEIGGYIELYRYEGKMLYDDGIKLNCAKNCLAYLLEKKNIKRVLVPYYLCDSIFDVLRTYNIKTIYYHLNEKLLPIIQDTSYDEDTWLYLVNYYGMIEEENIRYFTTKFQHIILDNVQAYFKSPLKMGGVLHTFYSCRKFFGVPDGAILYSDILDDDDIEIDVSHRRMGYLLGRFEESASCFYESYKKNNYALRNLPIMRMSRLTENLLNGINYDEIKKIRTENYRILHKGLKGINMLDIPDIIEGAFAYPLYIRNGDYIREALIKEKIYVPQLWPNVLCQKGETLEYSMAKNLLPLPCDQRYSSVEMDLIIKKCIELAMKLG